MPVGVSLLPKQMKVYGYLILLFVAGLLFLFAMGSTSMLIGINFVIPT